MTSYLLTLLASVFIILLTSVAIAILPWRSEELDRAEQELFLLWKYISRRILELKVLFIRKSSIQQPS